MPAAPDRMESLLNALTEAATDHAAAAEVNDETGMAKGAAYLRGLIAGIPREDLPEILFRITIEHGTACLDAYSE